MDKLNIGKFGLKLKKIIAKHEGSTEQKTINFVKKVNNKKETIYVYRINNNFYAYRKIKYNKKFQAYNNLIKTFGKNNQFINIYYIDNGYMEVVTDWINGEKIGTFNALKINKQLSNEIIAKIIKKIIFLHKIKSECYSPIEIEPLMPSMKPRSTLAITKNQSYFNTILQNYLKISQNIRHAQKNYDLSKINIENVIKLIKFGKSVIKENKKTLNSLNKYSLVHGDLHIENIIRHKNKIFLIDFENMHYGDPSWEISFFLEQALQGSLLDLKKAQNFTDLYLEKSKNQIDQTMFKQRLNTFHTYIVMRFLGLIIDGLASDNDGHINHQLFENVLKRAKLLEKKAKILY